MNSQVFMANIVKDNEVWSTIIIERVNLWICIDWNLAASRCTQVQCQNGGVCYEHSPAVSVFAYCACRAGFTGQLCETGHSKWFQQSQLVLIEFLVYV